MAKPAGPTARQRAAMREYRTRGFCDHRGPTLRAKYGPKMPRGYTSCSLPKGHPGRHHYT